MTGGAPGKPCSVRRTHRQERNRVRRTRSAGQLQLSDSFSRAAQVKIAELKWQGKTLLFVSHATGSVQSFCDRALWLDHGELLMDGRAAEIAAAYEGARVKVGSA
jgi:ABC-type branched-subunit amino acid transport system ATPase component